MSKQRLKSELFQALQERYAPDLQLIGEDFQQAVLIEPGRLLEVLAYLKADAAYQLNHLSNLTAVDYKDYYEMVYHLYSLPLKQSLTVKLRCDASLAQVPSVTGLWPSADFQEREVYDLMGITFTGHPQLRRILLPDDFPDHPLRKSYEFNPVEEKG
jgi:NADH-quinone oxidoreductase subunit C